MGAIEKGIGTLGLEKFLEYGAAGLISLVIVVIFVIVMMPLLRAVFSELAGSREERITMRTEFLAVIKENAGKQTEALTKVNDGMQETMRGLSANTEAAHRLANVVANCEAAQEAHRRTRANPPLPGG